MMGLTEQEQFYKGSDGKVGKLLGPYNLPQGATKITQQEYDAQIKTQTPNPNTYHQFQGVKLKPTPEVQTPKTKVQTPTPEYSPKKVTPSFWDNAIDFFLPGKPVEDGYDIINKFSDIIKRRIDYNKKNNLPLDKMTKEEINYRTTILNATPNYGYPDALGFLDVIKDIKSGKNIRQDEFTKYKNMNKSGSGLDYTSIGGEKKYTEQELKQMVGGREELKKMWLGLDDPNGLNVGNYVKSEFRPKDSTDPNAIYYKPKDIPKLTTPQFDELYSVILTTKKPDGKFPGGNGSVLSKTKLLDSSIIEKIRGDLGHFKLGAVEENGKKYISVYDEWDLFPPALKDKGINIQQFGKTPLIYYRINRI